MRKREHTEVGKTGKREHKASGEREEREKKELFKWI